MNVYPEEIADPQEPANLSSKGRDQTAGLANSSAYQSPRQTRLGYRFSEHCGAGDGVRDLELIAPVSARADRRVSIAGGRRPRRPPREKYRGSSLGES